MKILKRLKIWIGFKALRVVRGVLEEGIDEELEKALKETFVEFYGEHDLDKEDRKLMAQFLKFAKEHLLPNLLMRVESYLEGEK